MTYSAKILLVSCLCTLIAACVTTPPIVVAPPLPSVAADPGLDPNRSMYGVSTEPKILRQTTTPAPPEQGSAIAGASVKTSEPPLSGPPISASLADMPLPAFINEVFGNLLKLNFQMDPALGSKTDLVTLRLPSPQAPQDFYRLAVQLLREYGVIVAWDGNLLSVVASGQGQSKEPPLIISGRTLPDVPISHRPIFQLIELQAVRNRDVVGWLKVAYESSDLKIDEDSSRNAIVLFGKPELVVQAAAAIAVLDRPFMRGRHSIRLEPAFVSAADLAQRLIEVLSAEGYGVAGKIDAVSAGSNTIILPVASANIVLVFAADPALLTHVVDWARSIDKPNENVGGGGLFYYQVRNTKASDLATILRSLGGSAPQASSAAAASSNASAASGASSTAAPVAAVSSAFGSGRLTVDGPRNALIYQGEAGEWQRLLSLVKQMDKSARQVMIEVTIAEVSLDDNEEFGVSWLAKDNHGKYNGHWASGVVPAAAAGGAAGGLTYLLDIAGQNRAQLKAFSDDSRVSILSTPRLLVMSGQEANIDVGTEVPIITSQTTSNQQTEGSTNLLQSVQYRKTGIILNVKPTVYSDNRIDLEISQEVSEALPVGAGDAVQSPSIFNRAVKTSLSLRDGGSVLLGGLMSERQTRSKNGVPYLKDMPVLGNLFKSQSNDKNKTELVIIIVPYIIETDSQAQAITQAISDRLELIELPVMGAPVPSLPAAVPTPMTPPPEPAQTAPAASAPPAASETLPEAAATTPSSADWLELQRLCV